MQKKMPLRGQILNRDSMSVDGSNSQLFEDLMSDVSPEAEARINEMMIQQMREDGFSQETLDMMRKTQPSPPKPDE
jgi:hypothetical protein